MADEEPHDIIMDMGSDTLKVGFAGDDAPMATVQNRVGRRKLFGQVPLEQSKDEVLTFSRKNFEVNFIGVLESKLSSRDKKCCYSIVIKDYGILDQPTNPVTVKK